MPFVTRLLLCSTFILTISTQLSGCVTAVVGGAAAGGAVATDQRTAGIYVEDENIELKALQQIRKTLNDQAHVNVTSYNLNVLITGEVPNEEARTEAENIVKSIANVNNITNELVVGPKTSISDRANDTYLTSKVKAKFVAEKDFKANNVKIVTEASVVYLMGIVSTHEGNLATEIARTTDGVAKVVKVFEHKN
ncbi:MAG: BON domain-containing protein [Methylophilaceae bacterium]